MLHLPIAKRRIILNRVLIPYYTFFKRLRIKKCKSNKGLDSSSPAPSTNDPSYVHHPPKSANRIKSKVKKNCRTTIPYQNDSSDEKMKRR